MLDRIVASRDAPTNLQLALPKRVTHAERNVRYLNCPVCAKSMNRRAFGRISGVVVDVCRDDGVWFDAGELNAVLAFVSRGGLEKARRREADETRSLRRSELTRDKQAAWARQLSQAGALERQGPAGGRPFTEGVDFLLTLVDIWKS